MSEDLGRRLMRTICEEWPDSDCPILTGITSGDEPEMDARGRSFYTATGQAIWDLLDDARAGNVELHMPECGVLSDEACSCRPTVLAVERLA